MKGDLTTELYLEGSEVSDVVQMHAKTCESLKKKLLTVARGVFDLNWLLLHQGIKLSEYRKLQVGLATEQLPRHEHRTIALCFCER
jgi:hypothetical protein